MPSIGLMAEKPLASARDRKKRLGPLRQSANTQTDDSGERPEKKPATTSPAIGTQSASEGDGLKPKPKRKKAANAPQIAALTVADMLKSFWGRRQ